jgi:hypothetical protein
MTSAWGNSWGNAWGNSWGSIAPANSISGTAAIALSTSAALTGVAHAGGASAITFLVPNADLSSGTLVEPPVPPPPYRPSSGGYARPIPLEVIDFDTQTRIQDDHELVEIVQILAATGVFYGKV